MTTSTRRLEILRAIVDEYVATQEPVGSKAIADRHELGVSPATIRNEMALLEEEGLITAPHTSAGRIPCLLYTSPSPRDRTRSRMPSSA